MEKPGKIVLRLCSTCKDPSADNGFEQLEAAIADAGLPQPVELAPHACMNGCSAPVTMAVQGQGRATCFFTGIDVKADRADIISTLRAYIRSPRGWIEDARDCGRLRYCLVGRVPALTDD